MSFDKDDMAGKQTLDKTDSNNQNNSTEKKFGLNSDRPRFDFGSYVSKYDQKEHDVNDMIAAFRKNLNVGKGRASEGTEFTAGKAAAKVESAEGTAPAPGLSDTAAGKQKPAAGTAPAPGLSDAAAGKQKPAAEVKKAEPELKQEAAAAKPESKAEFIPPRQKAVSVKPEASEEKPAAKAPVPPAKPAEKPAAKVPVPPAKPEEKPAAKAPVPPVKPAEKLAAKAPLPPAKPEEKPAVKAPLPPAKPEEKSAAKAPVPPAKPAEKPAAKAPVPPAKPEEKPAVKAPVPPAKPEEKPAVKAPVPPAKPAEKPAAGADQKLPAVDSAAKQKVEEIKKRAEEAAKKRADGGLKGTAAGSGIRDAAKKLDPSDAAAREKVEAVKKKAEEAAKKRADSLKDQTDGKKPAAADLFLKTKPAAEKKPAGQAPEKAAKAGTQPAPGAGAKTEAAQDAKAKAKADKLKEKQLKAERKKAEKEAKKAAKEAKKTEKVLQKQEKKKEAEPVVKGAPADKTPAEKTDRLTDKTPKADKAVSAPEIKKQDIIKTAEDKASAVMVPIKGKIPEKPAAELTGETGEVLLKERGAVKEGELQAAAEKQGKKKKILFIVLALILAAALAIGGGITYHKKKVEEQNLKAARQYVELFFSTLKKGNVDKAAEYTEGDMETNLKFLSNMSETFDKQLDSGFDKQVSKKSRDKIKVKYKDFLSDLYKSWLVDYQFRGGAKKVEDTDNTYTVKVDATFNDLSAITSTSMSKKVNKLLQDYEKKHDMNKLKALYSKKGEKTVTEKIVTDVFDDYFKYLKKELKKAPKNESVVTATVKKNSDDSWIISKIADAKTNGTSVSTESSAASDEKSA